MTKMAELALDIEDLHRKGYPVYMIARITGATEFIVRQVVDDYDADESEEENHPWQN